MSPEPNVATQRHGRSTRHIQALAGYADAESHEAVAIDDGDRDNED